MNCFARHLRFQLIGSLLPVMAMLGCGMLPAVDPENQYGTEAEFVESGPIENPLFIPVKDREFAWSSIVDTVDDYFDIAQEQRVQLVGNVLTEGQIITQMKPGASLPERWHRDSTPGFERLQSTFQSIRRRAIVRVSPDRSGYIVHVTVDKELEDIDRPEQAAVGRELRRHDGGLVRPSRRALVGSRHLGWIPIGRDVSLEQTILSDLRARFFTQIAPIDVEQLRGPKTGVHHR